MYSDGDSNIRLSEIVLCASKEDIRMTFHSLDLAILPLQTILSVDSPCLFKMASRAQNIISESFMVYLMVVQDLGHCFQYGIHSLSL